MKESTLTRLSVAKANGRSNAVRDEAERRDEPREISPFAVVSRRAVSLRLFITCVIVFGLHFATNTVREIYPALSLGDRLSFDVSEYNGLHPDIFEMPGRGVFINNNPGASVMGAVPYVLARPLVDTIVERVNSKRASEPSQPVQGYDSIYPMAREFYERSREKGYDVKFGLGAAIMQAFVMVPLAALSVVLMYLILLHTTRKPRAATLLALLYAFATPVFYRTAQLNQNLLLAHFALFAFVLLWRPSSAGDPEKRPFYFLAGLCAGWTVVLDYSGLVALLVLTGYAGVRWLGTEASERSITELVRFAVGVTICGAFLMAYQWSSFGNPILPAQNYMPPANFSDAGYQGFSLPSLDLLFDTAFSLRFGLFTSAPILLLAFYVPAWFRKQTTIFERREIFFIVAFVALFFIFCAANQFGRMQFNTGVRHIVPVVPFVFLLAANVLLRMPAVIASIAGAVGTYCMWCLVMYRDVEQGLGIPEAIKNITLGGFQLPWLSTLERMGYAPEASPLPLMLLAGAVIWILWNVNGNRQRAEA